MKPAPEMEAKEYSAAIAALNLSQVKAAKLMGLAIRTSWGYANGEPIPTLVGLYLRELLKTEKRATQKLHKKK